MKHTKPTIGIALGGGGPRGVAHLGALQAFFQAGLTPTHISGTSVGALIGALTAFEIPFSDQLAYAKTMSWWTITKPILSRFGVVSNYNITSVIEHFLPHTTTIETAKTPLTIVATDISNGVPMYLRTGLVSQAVMASSAIPGVFTPVTIGEHLLVDGGLLENIPYTPLADCDLIIGIDLMKNILPRTPANIIEVMANAMYIMLSHTKKPPTNKPDIVLTPDLPTLIRTEPQALQQMYDIGYACGMASIPAITQRLNELTTTE